jgi:two-component system, chemotaxis family, chemotaxis protein CheY
MSDINIDRIQILIVDDDNEVRNVIKNYLIHFGFNSFLEAKDGSEAYRYILDMRQRIDLIISDWEMPKTDGLTLLKAVRRHNQRSHTPFIMVTSQQSQERMKITNAKLAEVSGYIVKPFRAEVLKEKVWMALNLAGLKSEAS